jgi:FixJ family two-component response regulator
MNAFPVPAVVFLVDDEESVLKALSRMLRVSGFNVRAWSDPHDFLAEHDPDVPGCLVLDALMPGLPGLEVQRILVSGGSDRRIVFISGTTDVSTCVEAMKAGAVTCLSKPVRMDALLAAVREAMQMDALGRETRRLRAA